MAVTLFKEITSRGDSFGFSVDAQGRTVQKATRVFIVQIDSTDTRSIDEIYTLLPAKGDVHPYITSCYVKDVSCDVTEDVHIYEAKVNYESTIVDTAEDDAEEPDITYPWDEDASISFSSDASQMEAMEYAYLQWPYAAINGSSRDEILATTSTGEMATAKLPIINLPLREKFESVPEEPIKCTAIDISFAIKGYSGTNRKIHDRSIIYRLKGEFFTVNNDDMTLFAYTIKKGNGYVADCNITDKFYISKKKKKYAYYEVNIKILENPKSWIRRIQNVSYNTLKPTPGDPSKNVITHIKVRDADTGKDELVTKPMAIAPLTAAPLDLDAAGNFKSAADMESEVGMYVIPYLTKQPSDWTAIKDICDKAAG